MGYNGSNRKGYDRRYRGLSKSSMRSGNSMLFGKKGIVTGLFDVGSSIAKDVTNYDPPIESNVTANTEGNSNTAFIIIASILGIGAIVLIIVYAPLILGILAEIGILFGLGKR